jgi:hypothetical protein
MIKYKLCDCEDDECWQEIVVKDDIYFPNNTKVIYFHCCCCGTDFRIEDFETGEELYIEPE